DQAYKDCESAAGLNRTRFLALPRALQRRLLLRLCEEQALELDLASVERAERAVRDATQEELCNGIMLRCTSGELRLVGVAVEASLPAHAELTLDGSWTACEHSGVEVALHSASASSGDAHMLELPTGAVFPLLLRHRQPGDRALLRTGETR